MSTNLYITSTAQLIKGDFVRNGNRISSDAVISERDWFRSQYELLNIKYPKFHKMDPLCKLAMLTSKVLLADFEPTEDIRKQTGLLLYNAHSSIDADIQHQQLIEDQEQPLPSPAVFVYTLPNIMLGEICIRYGITGENLCLITPQFDADSAVLQCEMMFDAGMEKVIIGWIDTFNDTSKAWMALVEKDGNAPNYSQFSASILNELHNIPEWKHS